VWMHDQRVSGGVWQKQERDQVHHTHLRQRHHNAREASTWTSSYSISPYEEVNILKSTLYS
jgi:hypothetical protein